MKKILYSLFAVLAISACDSHEEADPIPEPTPAAEFEISLQQDKLSAFGVTFDISPQEKSALYYYEIASKERMTEVNIATIKEEITESAQFMADLLEVPFEEMLASMLYSGDQFDLTETTGFRPETDYYIYAFYWEESEELTLFEFRTPAMIPSTEEVTLTASIESHKMTIEVTPTPGVVEYWYYFAERTKAEAMLAELEDENAFISYHAMNVGTRMEGQQSKEHQGLKPSTEYMVLVMGIDEGNNRFEHRELFTTTEEQGVARVESELFESLLGEWSGVQTVLDTSYTPATNNFTVNIQASVADYDYDYRAKNQLVATVDGWCDIAYYSLTDLVEQGIENPESKWGPKWLFNIAEGDVVTLDGKGCNSVVGWLYWGDCFMLNTTADGFQVRADLDFEVEISEDGNQITIKSPAATEGFYPGLGYNFEGFGWFSYCSGCSEIVLTRQ